MNTVTSRHMHDTIYCLVHVVGGPQKQRKDLNFQRISCTLHCVTYELIVSPSNKKKILYETLPVSINLSIYLAHFLYWHTPQSLLLYPRPRLCPPFWFHRKYGQTHSVGWKWIPHSEKLLRGFNLVNLPPNRRIKNANNLLRNTTTG